VKSVIATLLEPKRLLAYPLVDVAHIRMDNSVNVRIGSTAILVMPANQDSGTSTSITHLLVTSVIVTLLAPLAAVKSVT